MSCSCTTGSDPADRVGETRRTILLNKGWKFTRSDDSDYQGKESHDAAATPYSRKGFDDSGWDDVHLPHNFDVPFWGGYFQTNATCWYRKHLRPGEAWKGKRLILEFEGVYQHAYIWVNDQYIGHHEGGYTGFLFDVTHAISWGQDNVIAIKVSNEWIGDDRYITLGNWAEYSKFGGIYRNVHLRITEPLHVPFAGVHVSTPEVNKSAGRVKIETQVVNKSMTEKKRCTLTSEILDAEGRTLATLTDTQDVPPGEMQTFIQQSERISGPHLWSPDTPYLYRVETTVKDRRRITDRINTSFGFRWFTFDPSRGFFLNGKRMFLRGFNVHQDEYGWGSASVDAKFYRDIKILKACGARIVRMSHYPHPRAVYRACDELGMLVMDELCFAPSTDGPDNDHGVGAPYTLPDKRAQDYLKETMQDVVIEHRNHPSIISMCVGNETEGSHSGLTAGEMATLHRELCDIVHDLSPDWVTTSHIRHRGPGGFYQAINAEMDMIGWYGDESEHAAYPDKCFLPTEAGSYGRGAPGNYTGHDVPADGWPQRPWEVGGIEWCAFSYGSTDYPDGPFQYSNISIIDYNRLPKRDYFWYVDNWRHQGGTEPSWPAVDTPARIALTADKTTIRTDGTDDCLLTATLLNSKGEHVIVENERENPVMITLTVTQGNAMLPGGSPTLPAYTGISGQTAVSLRSYTPGTVEVTATAKNLDPGKIEIHATGK